MRVIAQRKNQFLKIIKGKLPLLVIMLLAIFTRFWNLSYPPSYIFDEVYHAFTAAAYAQNDPAGYEWWHTSPVKGTAYEWLHPPIAKLFMAAGILIFGDNSLGWRFFSAVFGVLAIWLLYLVGKQLFNEKVGLTAAFLGSLDGLFLVQSRIAMNDIFLVVFILAAIYFLLKWQELSLVVGPGGCFPRRPSSLRLAARLRARRRGAPTSATHLYILTFFFTGLATATKWPGIFLVPIIILTIIYQFYKQKWHFNWLKRQLALFLVSFLLIPLIYISSYAQFWWQGHTIQKFIELHKQIWWYQTTLKATHDYGSPAWQWPLMIRPVWYFVNYEAKGRIGNIYALGNPLIWWSGLVAMVFVFYKAVKSKTISYKLLAISYLLFWLPWLFSPRVMFLYHYLPSLTFLILGLAWFINEIKEKNYRLGFLLGCVLIFIFFYPYWLGLAIPEIYRQMLLWLPTWK